MRGIDIRIFRGARPWLSVSLRLSGVNSSRRRSRWSRAPRSPSASASGGVFGHCLRQVCTLPARQRESAARSSGRRVRDRWNRCQRCPGPARAVALGNSHLFSQTFSYGQPALIEPWSSVLNGQNRVRLRPGDNALILDSGPVGTLHVKLPLLRGAGRVIRAQDPKQRRQIADLFAQSTAAAAAA